MPLSDRCISRAGLRGIVVSALQSAATLAQDRVYEPRDIPTDLSLFPALLVQTPIERKESLGRTTAPQFNTTVTIAVTARVQGDNPGQVETDLDTLATQVEQAVLCSDDVMKTLQQVASVDTEMVVTAESETHVGQAAITFACETFQRYDPPPAPDLVEIGLDVDFNGDGVPDVLAAALLDTVVVTDPDGDGITSDGREPAPIASDNPSVPFNPLTGDPA